MKIKTMSRGYNPSIKISNMSVSLFIRMQDGETYQVGVIRRPLSNLGYGHALITNGDYNSKNVTLEQITKHLKDAYEHILGLDPKSVSYFDFSVGILDYHHGRLLWSAKSTDNEDVHATLRSFKTLVKNSFAVSKLQ